MYHGSITKVTKIPTNCAQLLLHALTLEADSPAASSRAYNYLTEEPEMDYGDVEECYDLRRKEQKKDNDCQLGQAGGSRRATNKRD